MRTVVSFRELNALLSHVQRETRRVRNEFADISGAFNVILESPHFVGRTKDAIDDVVRNMHLPIIVGIYESYRLFMRHLERAVDSLSISLHETDERGVIDDDGLAEFERSLSDFSQAKYDFDQDFQRIYQNIDEYLQLSMPGDIGYNNSRDELANLLSNRREALHTFSYDMSELEDLYSQTKSQMTRLSNTVNLSFTDSSRLAISRQTDFRSFINELHGREVLEQEERIQALLHQWAGQDPAVVFVELARPLSEEAQIAWVRWTGSTQMLTPEEREMLGQRQAGSGVARALGGVMVVVVTGGKSILFKIAGAVLGGYSIVSGGFDVAEGVQNMWLGSRDDVTTYAVNPLLDIVYDGNRELYNNVNMFAGMMNWITISTAQFMPDQPQQVPPPKPLNIDNVADQLTRSQSRNIKKLNNIIDKNLTKTDFSGTLRDLQGNPVPKTSGGFWDHKTEMVQSHSALQGIVKGLEGSLQNPGLSLEARNYIQAELNRANFYLIKIENLFRPFGGVQ